MGKTRKRLTMAKYARKYANIRANIAKMQGKVSNEIAETTNNIQLSSQQATQKEEVVAKVVPVVAEKKSFSAEKITKEVPVEPVLAQKEQPQAPEVVEDSALETIKTAKVEKTVSKKTTTRKRNPSNRVKTGTRVAKSKRTKAKG